MVRLVEATGIDIALVVGMAFILSKTVPLTQSKVGRFILLFLVCVPFLFGVNYVDVALLDLPKMGWTGASIIALLFAGFGTAYPPQLHRYSKP